MANRPCRADGDLKRIWQLLLPDTRLPACGTREDAGADREQRGADAGDASPRADRARA